MGNGILMLLKPILMDSFHETVSCESRKTKANGISITSKLTSKVVHGNSVLTLTNRFVVPNFSFNFDECWCIFVHLFMGTNTINGDKAGINSFEMTMNRLICESEILILTRVC